MNEIFSLLKKRKSNTHKGDYGHIFVLAGSQGLTGAAYLTCSGALLSGSGLVTLGIPKDLNSIMEVKLTEVMTLPLAQTKQLSLSLKALTQIKDFLHKADVLAIGPGLSQHKETQSLICKLLESTTKPIVLDADGINALKGNLEILNQKKAEMVITPHPGELSRLLNIEINQIQKNRTETAKKLAKDYKLVVVLKGCQTVVANPSGQVYINITGNPGMASGGCGDVLTGIIASLIGQNMGVFEASKLGVYVHGLAGDLAAEEKGEISLIASDILAKLPLAFKKI